MEHQGRQPRPLALDGPFPVDQQRKLGEEMIRLIGFDFTHGRLDVSAHPFTGGTADDVRITTRYDQADFARALMGVLHETGHGLYEAGLPRDWRRQPVGNARGMVLHESQSLLMEMQACRSDAFLSFAAPRMRAAFGREGAAWTADNIHRVYTRVAPGFIRVDADEVTYPLHIMLRYRLERAMLAGDLKLADLPGAWNEGMRELWASCRRTIRWAACRTSIGRTAAGAISRPTRWARWRPPSSLPRPIRPIPALWRPSARAILRPCCPGCASMCTARARLPAPTRS
jgi:carboxypeptidase Taq